jgi:Regulator of chromosome condensation (RCC1) repeat
MPTLCSLCAINANAPSLSLCTHNSIIACADGAVFAFGRNDSGQLGVGDTTDRMTPARVEGLRGHRTVALACGQYHTAAVTAAGALLTCGKNDWGQLGFPAAVPASGSTVAGMYIYIYTFSILQEFTFILLL